MRNLFLFFLFLAFHIQVLAQTVTINHTYYTIEYDYKHKIPSYVKYILTPNMAKDLETDVKRSNYFRKDKLFPHTQGTATDYRKTGYDRGHLCPSEDMDFSKVAMDESMVYTNIAPQNPNLNRGFWRRLENQVRRWAEKDTIFVISGTIITPNDTSIGSNVNVPTYFYKIIVNKDSSAAIAFLVKNLPNNNDIKTSIVTINAIEELTNLDFFKGHPNETMLEGNIDMCNWFTR
jgi:endonuclease G